MELSFLIETALENWYVILLFFTIAILYSSVGFGGGSSYLAVLAITGLAFTEIRSTSLLCNIVVVSSNVVLFWKRKLYNWKKVTPLVLFSIPMAFLGGYLQISQHIFFILLGITLLLAAITMWYSKTINTLKTGNNNLSLTKNITYGGFIGFISGMVGIGGGIFLAPLLHLTNWDTPKRIAATASFFILLNSISGLIGQYINPKFSINWQFTSILLITVFIGGQIGNRLSNKLLTPIQLKKATAILIAFVSIKILLK
ncbi:sulfite exporter TauE/SafE family protein [Tenacibaculum sp. 190524A02b]|uniref:Probable membrane transporter protein n=1 Tax=Tenacibaculum vairaonense TaxID=3137860 RepID=A0ABM9PHX6_9FLAO